jgi:hypothetical protein
MSMELDLRPELCELKIKIKTKTSSLGIRCSGHQPPRISLDEMGNFPINFDS